MPTTNSGFFIQSTFGTKGNFDAVFPGRTSGLAHVWRDNDNPALPWSAPQFFATGTFSSSSLIQSNFGTPGIGNLEVVAKTGNNLVHFWRNDQTPLTWSGPTSIAGGVSGNPALIQGRFGTKGNFEMVAPLLAGGIGHWWRDNDAGNIWHGPTSLATGIGPINGVALIQSNFGTPGNLEVVATIGTSVSREIVHFWRDNAGWHGPNPILLPAAFGAHPEGVPGFIQSADGNSHVVFPSNGLAHIWRENADSIVNWNPLAKFGGYPMTIFGAASLIQSNYGPPGLGNLELLARKSDAGPGVHHVVHFWRAADEPTNQWHGPGGDLLGPPPGTPGFP